jgi:uncharacterized protein (TIGR00290 family)
VAKPKACVSWSSGKDSAFALWETCRRGDVDVVGVLTTVNAAFDRVAMHGVRRSLLERQVAALGLPALIVEIPSPCPNEVYEQRMAEACATLAGAGVSLLVFGDLFLEDIRAYREDKLRGTGLEPIFPLWRRDTRALAADMIGAGLEAYITCLDPRRLDPRLAGRRFDADLLKELPPGVDPCGENGEFHTVVTAGPMFLAPIPVIPGEIVERDGFVFADIVPQIAAPRT